MNQIIYPEKIEDNTFYYKYKKANLYKLLFAFSLVILFSFISYYIFLCFNIDKKQKISKSILGIYDIQHLYSSNTEFSLPCVVSKSGDIANIIGIIEIKKINLRYPILDKTTDEFLDIAPCKFYGPNLNTYGNFCIAGHNYDNNELFSNLKMLETGDLIAIHNLNRQLYFLCNL